MRTRQSSTVTDRRAAPLLLREPPKQRDGDHARSREMKKRSIIWLSIPSSNCDEPFVAEERRPNPWLKIFYGRVVYAEEWLSAEILLWHQLSPFSRKLWT